MASFKNKKNLLQQRGEYARYFDRLRGVDFSSDHNDVEDSRFAYLVNMYRDYQSGQGGAVETIPGFRRLRQDIGTINGIHIIDKKIYLHLGNKLCYYGKINDDGGAELESSTEGNYIDGLMPNERMISFVNQGKLYFLGGKYFMRLQTSADGSLEVVDVANEAYVPTRYTHISIKALRDTVAGDDGGGREYEQRNLLTSKYKLRYIADGEHNYFPTKEPIDDNVAYQSNLNQAIALFPENLGASCDVYQYGVRLPMAYNNGSGAPHVPAGYPNAITSITPADSPEGNGMIQLVSAPPKPEENTWNPTTKKFDTVTDSYKWPFAFEKEYDGIEVIVNKKIKNVGGETNSSLEQDAIISKCTIACEYDNRIFLSGNPDFPSRIFYSSIPAKNTLPLTSPTYFGELDTVQDGMSDAPIIAMMNVGDSLMVLKKDGDGAESIFLHTAQTGVDDIVKKLYPAQRGHKGLGCLGPCINFRDDPIFLSKNGVDALGHVSTKYRRAIRHRSSLIDAKLLNCDLATASMVEYNGYLMILVDGKIFMADSRQMYNTPDGGTEYEWYYLEDIGEYSGQFSEYVYAEFPAEETEEQRLQATGGIEIIEARAVRDDNGIARDLIGSSANSGGEEIKSVETEYGITYYRELPEYDEYTHLTGRTIKYYVVPSGGKTGGTFIPAKELKVIGNDLFFYTTIEKANNSSLYKFNFDMRDPETGLIPHEYYNFNGRAIFSGCATKMDNCSIPHLTKTTVKRSTVIKTRSFEASGIKVKVRTNRKAFNQIARIVNSQATFDDPDFKAYSFSTAEKNIFAVNEREKKWVEKQIFLYSDEYCRPFAIHYIAYRYVIAGRYKE